MKIRNMTATFGGLEQAVLAPSEGLTVITAPNEGGTSTWAGFVKAMLYGVDTRERDKGGVLADKNRYQPWSGTPMWGELQLEWEGREVTLRRTSNKSGPMQGFEAVYTASGDPVPGLTAANAGQTLLGAGRDVFVRSALVGQNGTAVTAAPELERRIAALATSGQEDVSFSATERTLKDWKNRRRLNRSNGLIPELERELGQVEQALDELRLARDRKVQAEGQIKALEEERRELNSDLEIHRRLAQKELNRRYGMALEAANEAQRKLEELPAPDPAFAGLTARQARELAQESAAEARARWSEQETKRAELHHTRKIHVNTMRAAVAIAAVSLILLVLELLIKPFARYGSGFSFAFGAALAFFTNRRVDKLDKELAGLTEITEPDGRELAQAEAYADWLARKELLEQEVRHCRQRAEDLKAQGAREFDTLELLHIPAQSAAETAARISAVTRELGRWQSQLDQAIGALGADPLTLEARRDELLAERKERTLQYDALELALGGLERANGVLRERFSPALNQEAARIFAKLTGGRYASLSLSRDFSALTGTADSAQPHSAAYLSAGTVDQLYLAVRLAVCRLSLPDAPVLLDDALTAFDDARAELALDYLKELAQERQILLFTCHSREARWAERHGVPVIHM